MKAWSLWEGSCTSSWVVLKNNIRSLVAGKKSAFNFHSFSSYALLPEIQIIPCFQSWSDLEKLESWLNFSDAKLILFQNCTNIQLWNWKLTFYLFGRAIQFLGEWIAFASPCSIGVTSFPERIRSSSSRLPAIYKNLWLWWCPVSLMSFTNSTVF